MVNLDVLEGGWKGSPLWWAWVEIFRCVHQDAIKIVAYVLQEPQFEGTYRKAVWLRW